MRQTSIQRIQVVLAVLALAAVSEHVGGGLAPKKKTKVSRYRVMAGQWTVETVGEKVRHGGRAESFTRKQELTFNAKAKEFSGSPFGWKISDSRLLRAQPGGRVAFTTEYELARGHDFAIKWRGKLSEDGTKITEGTFSCEMGSGTFTAEKKVADEKKE